MSKLNTAPHLRHHPGRGDHQHRESVHQGGREGACGKGIATALLDRSLEWARVEGYWRCAVDFEPVSYALVRQIDERIVQSLALP
ncbi:MAG: hypothetical protein U9R15_14525 [Chloroflexota bacterium]|nr:hypothetical protein [Chloroflexota bacterium]